MSQKSTSRSSERVPRVVPRKVFKSLIAIHDGVRASTDIRRPILFARWVEANDELYWKLQDIRADRENSDEEEEA